MKAVNYKQEKRCPRCKEVKDRSQYSVCKNNSDGLYGYCKKCSAEMSRERYYKQKAKKNIATNNALSYRARRAGVEYKFSEHKQKGKYRDIITYTCTNCDEIVTQNRKFVIENGFVCEKCLENHTSNFSKLPDIANEFAKSNINKEDNTSEKQNIDYNQRCECTTLEEIVRFLAKQKPTARIVISVEENDAECEECNCNDFNCNEHEDHEKAHKLSFWQKLKRIFKKC